MLQEHFARFGNENHIFEITEENRKLYEEDEGYRQYLAFFSDNNSCLRRSVWEQIPYDDVDYAEDQFWARKIWKRATGRCIARRRGFITPTIIRCCPTQNGIMTTSRQCTACIKPCCAPTLRLM